MRIARMLLVLALAAGFFALATGPAHAGKAGAPTLKIGVFDSRAVALAYGRSPEVAEHVANLRKEQSAAKAANDSTRVQQLENEGQWMQVRLHQQVFSTAGVNGIMAKVADALPAIAREAGVVLIVSKWEMPFAGPSVETVDVTLPLAKLFKPDEKTLQIIEQIKSQKPIPFEDLPLDPRM